MFFLMLLVGFAMTGSILCIIDMVLPGVFIPFVAMGIKLLGICLIWCGIGVYISRAGNTGGALLIDLPNPNTVKLLHIGNSGAKLVNSRKAELNSLIVRGKNRMRIKDMGHSIPVAGHEIQISSQTTGFTLPLWVLDLIDSWKKQFGMRNKDEWVEIYESLKSIKDTDTSFLIEQRLSDIDILKPVMADENKKQQLLSLKPEELRNMAECLFDGRTVNAKAYLDWDEAANPYDNESIISRSLAHRAEQRSSYLFGGSGDYMKYIVPLCILFILGAIAYQIFAG